MASKATKMNAYIVDCRIKVNKNEYALTGDSEVIWLLNSVVLARDRSKRMESIALRTEEVL